MRSESRRARPLPAVARRGRAWIGRTPALRRVLAVVAMVVLASTTSGTAAAHTTLVGSTPGFGETVDRIDVIELRFGDRILFDATASVEVTTLDGSTAATGALDAPDTFTLRLRPAGDELDRGDYIVRYVVRSIDGDLNEGAIQFRFEPAGGGGAGTWVLLTVGALAVAAVLFLLRPRPRRDPARP